MAHPVRDCVVHESVVPAEDECLGYRRVPEPWEVQIIDAKVSQLKISLHRVNMLLGNEEPRVKLLVCGRWHCEKWGLQLRGELNSAVGSYLNK